MARHGERPMFPLNLLADLGGGGLMLAFGVVCSVFEARRSGVGQVVDAAMVDGVALMTGLLHGFRAAGAWNDVPGTNFLDSGAHFYEVYRTRDGGHMAVAAIEPQFYDALLAALGLNAADLPQWDRRRWPEFKKLFADVFAQRTRDEWATVFDGVDACTTPVLGLREATTFPHNVVRGVFEDAAGASLPAPAPRFSRTPGQVSAGEVDGPLVERLLARWAVGDIQTRAAPHVPPWAEATEDQIDE